MKEVYAVVNEEFIQPGRKTVNQAKRIHNYLNRLVQCILANKSLYVMIIPVVAFYIIFHYVPMYGVIIAFKNFQPGLGIHGSDWVGLKNFVDFFSSSTFVRLLKNTLIISFSSILFGFPAPILLALSINEVANSKVRRVVQTITYIPHFISLVVVCGIVRQFVSSNGVVTSLLNSLFGLKKVNLLQIPQLFVPIYVITEIWQTIGWGSIIYLSAITSIDTQLYDAAKIDGAGRFRQITSVTIPGIMPTVIIMLILRLGNVMSVGFEKIILLYNPAIYSTSDVISSFTYRKGLIDFSWSYSAAVGLFNSLINFIFVISANWISRRLNDTSLW